MRRLHRFVTLVACAAGLGLAGGGGCGGDVSRSDACTGDASLFISWSFGTEPLATACAARGVDHLEVSVENSCVVTISPVPCALDRFRYDKQLAGGAVIGVVALDARGNLLASGRVATTLGPTIPSTPVPITLR